MKANNAHVIAEFVDIERYPLHLSNDKSVQALVHQSRAALSSESLFLLPGFLHAEGIDRLTAQVDHARRHAEYRKFERTPYNFKAITNTLPADHPRRHREIYDLAYIYADQLRGNGLNTIYEWTALTRFLSAVIAHDLYLSEDSKYSLLVSLIANGGRHGWHFDTNDFAVTLMLRPARSGGVFEYVPALRAEGDENYDEVTKVLANKSSRVVAVDVEPGTLVLFHGHYSMHRVSPVSGDEERCMAILSYAREPGLVFDHTRLRGSTLATT